MDPVFGFKACVVLWVAGAVSFPLVNALTAFGAEQLLFWRGAFMAVPLAILCGARSFMTREGALFLAAFSGAIGGLASFMCSRSLGVGRSMLMGATVPLVVAFIGYCTGRRLARGVLLGMVLVVFGVALLATARTSNGPRESELVGFLWGVLTAISVACHWETMGRTSAPLSMRVFWIGVAGMCVGIAANGAHVPPALSGNQNQYALLVLFCVLNGPVRFWAIGHMTMNLEAEVTSTLASGEILLTVLVASWTLGERLTLSEQCGAVFVVVGSLTISLLVKKSR